MKVVSEPTDLRGRLGTTRRSSWPRAMAWYQVPALPKYSSRNSIDWFLRSAPVWMPSRFIFSAVLGPMPWNLATGSSSTKAAPFSGGITVWPLGLRWSEASLARNLL